MMPRHTPLRLVASSLGVLLISACSANYVPTPVPTPPPTSATPVPGTRFCGDPLSSYDPTPLPPPGQVPSASSMGRVADRGRLIVGVSSDALSMASREAATGDITGFEIDLAHAVADAILGPGGKLELRVVPPADALNQTESGDLDLVIDQIGISCSAWARGALSAAYLQTELRALTRPGVDFTPSVLSRSTACVAAGTQAQDAVGAKAPKVIAGRTWSDCLMRFQRGEVDVVLAPQPIAGGLARQDPYAKMSDAKLGNVSFGVLAPGKNIDMVRFVNAVLAQQVASGAWQRSYDTWVRPYAGDNRPPTPTYGRSR